jgi:DNA-directed RNA polymerase specialized sigma24 family protein
MIGRDSRPLAGEAHDMSFDQLLSSPRYEELRSRLIRIFARRGCSIPEDLADETVSRVLAKLREIAPTYEGDPVRFFHAVARNVYLEYMRRPRTVPIEEDLDWTNTGGDEASSSEVKYECLEACIGTLGRDDRWIIGEYYLHRKSAKIDHRKEIAAHLGIGMNALRIKACRIRRRLQGCAFECMQKRSPDEMKELVPHSRVRRPLL